MIDLGLATVDRVVGVDPDGRPVDQQAARILRLSDRAAGRDGPQTRAQHLDHAPDPRPRRPGDHRRRLHHRRLRQSGDERRLRHRHHRLPHPRHHQLPGHHQGRDPHRRGRRALHPRRHPRQADGDRRRPVGGADRREGRPAAPPRARRGERLLRFDGRRVEIRPRRRHRRPDHPRGQHLRRHHHRRHPARTQPVRRRRHLHQAVGRRRPGLADPGADHLARRRHAGRQGRHARLGRPGGARPAQRLSDRAVHGGADDVRARRHSRSAVHSVRDSRRADGLRRRRDSQPPGQGSRHRRCGRSRARREGARRAEAARSRSS